jgi:hypothetical protein
MISNLSLLFFAIAKVALYTGFGPGIVITILFEKFGVGARRPEQSEPGHVRGSNPRFVSDFLLANSKSSAGGRLAPIGSIPDRLSVGATSPPRKVRHA